ncbi:MAG: hypothetical protein HY873_04710 [Chloroflexi bacterium]|nr:hypothetical protein [Chloroflexota bacterium]
MPDEITPAEPEDEASLPPPVDEAIAPADAAEPPGTVTPGGYAYEVIGEEGGPTSAADTATFARPPRGIPVWGLIVAAAVPAAAVAALMWFLVGGGGDDDGRVTADTTNLLHAFTQSNDGTTTLRYEGAFPPGYPDGVPSYDGAEVVASVAQIQDPNIGYIVVQDVDDDRDTVAASMKELFDTDPWQVEVGQDGAETTLYQYRNTDDADLSGVVLITGSADGERTTILTSIQNASGAEGRVPDPFEPIDARATPPDFPDEVPGYEGALLIESAYQKEPGSKSFALSYITKDAADDVLDALRDHLDEADLDVEDADASEAALEDAQAIRFSDADLQLTGEIVVGVFQLDDDYTRIDVQVRDER